jgi:hypothetical protein
MVGAVGFMGGFVVGCVWFLKGWDLRWDRAGNGNYKGCAGFWGMLMLMVLGASCWWCCSAGNGSC